MGPLALVWLRRRAAPGQSVAELATPATDDRHREPRARAVRHGGA
jgi:hypothetical protein